MRRRIPGWGYTLLLAAGLGLVLLGVGGRMAMHVIAQITTGTGRFTLGGTVTVVALGALCGAIAGLILLGARFLLRRWSPAPSMVYWALLIGLTLRGIKPVDSLKAAAFFPVVILFGVALQWSTWSVRNPRGI